MRAMTFQVPIHTISEANCSEHWSKRHKRHVQQQLLVRMAYAKFCTETPLPCVVTLIRLSPRILDDDNLQMAFKYIRDELSECIIPGARKTYIDGRGKVRNIKGRVDSDPRITWRYEQRKSPIKGIEVMIESREEDSTPQV